MNLNQREQEDEASSRGNVIAKKSKYERKKQRVAEAEMIVAKLKRKIAELEAVSGLHGQGIFRFWGSSHHGGDSDAGQCEGKAKASSYAPWNQGDG
jgi:hypothetical protein